MELHGRWIWIASALIAASGAVPTAAADGPPSCAEVPDEADARLTGSYYLATGVTVEGDSEGGNGTVDASKTGVWEDTNALEGIQTEGGTCVDGDGDQVAFDADSRTSQVVDDAYEDVETAINDAYEDANAAINDAWAALVDLVNSLF